MKHEKLLEDMKRILGDNFISSYQKGEPEAKQLWMRIKKEGLRDAVKYLTSLGDPQLSFIVAMDLEKITNPIVEGESGKKLMLTYTFTMFHEDLGGEMILNLVVTTPKEDPVIPSISDLCPLAEVYEREAMSIVGVEIPGVEKTGYGKWTPPDFPEDIYPLRLDEKGLPDDMKRRFRWREELEKKKGGDQNE
jgi:membrane-bound hydrogenase subunit beta